MMNENIYRFKESFIPKENISNQKKQMDDFHQNVVDFLYSGITKDLVIEEISVDYYSKNRDKLKTWDNYSGIYVFIKNSIPVYIGKAGTGKSKNHNFTTRINQEIGHKNQTFPKNMKEIDQLKTIKDAIFKISKLNIIFIKSGNKGDKANATVLESLLIALFYPKYNK